MVVTTAELLRSQGYSATGLNQMTAAARAPKGSMYHYFPGGKEELAEQAIEYYVQLVDSLLVHCLRRLDVGDGIAAFITALAHQLERSAFRDGCPVGAVAMEAAAHQDRLAAVTQAGFARWRATIEQVLTERGIPNSADRATTIVAAVEGGVMLCRAHRSIQPLNSISRTLRALLTTDTPIDAATST